jgi:hypothetical protein
MHLSSHTTAPIGAQRVARRTARGPRRRRAPDTPSRTDRKRSRHRLCVSRCAGKLPRRCSLRAPSRTAAGLAAASTRATAARHEPPARGHRSRRSGASMGPIGATSGAASRPTSDCPSMPRGGRPETTAVMHAQRIRPGALPGRSGKPRRAGAGTAFTLGSRARVGFSALTPTSGSARAAPRRGCWLLQCVCRQANRFRAGRKWSKWDTTAADLP